MPPRKQKKRADEDPEPWKYVKKPTRSGRGQPAATEDATASEETTAEHGTVSNIPAAVKRKRKLNRRHQTTSEQVAPQYSDDEQEVVRKPTQRGHPVAQSMPTEIVDNEGHTEFEETQSDNLTQHSDASDFNESGEFTQTITQDDSEARSNHEDDESFARNSVPKETRSTRKKRTTTKKPNLKQASKTVVPASCCLEEFRIPIASNRHWKNAYEFVKFFNDGTINPKRNAPHEYKPFQDSARY